MNELNVMAGLHACVQKYKSIDKQESMHMWIYLCTHAFMMVQCKPFFNIY